MNSESLEEKYMQLANAILAIADERDNPLETIKFVEKSLDLFEMDNEGWKGLSLIVKTLIQKYHTDNTDTIDHILTNLEQKFLTDELDRFYEQIITAFYSISDQQKCFHYTDQWIELNQERKNHPRIVDGISTRGSLNLLYHSDLKEAETQYQKGLDLARKIDDPKSMDRMVYMLANLNQHYKANFDTSYDYYEQGYKLAVKADDQERQAFFVEHMAMARHWQERYEEALELNNRALDIFGKERIPLYLYSRVLEAFSLIKLGRYNEAFEALLDVRELKEEDKDVFTHVDYLLFLSDMAREIPEKFNNHINEFQELLGEAASEQEIIDLACNYAKEHKHAEGIGRSGVYKANYLWKQGKKDETLKVLKETHDAVQKPPRGQVLVAIQRFLDTNNLTLD